MPPPPIRRFHRRPPPPSLPVPCALLAAEPARVSTDPRSARPIRYSVNRPRRDADPGEYPAELHLPEIPSIKATGFRSAADDLATLVAAGRVIRADRIVFSGSYE